MKMVICLATGILFHFISFAQTWNEFFRQKRTQIKYHLRQIAALQVYIELGQKGYGIYREGLDVIGDITDGEFSLHKDYFGSLSAVNPKISRAHLAEIILWDEQVILLRARIIQMPLGKTQQSLSGVFEQLVQKSRDHRAQLELLMTDGNYQLTDEDRMEQINTVHGAQRSLYNFAKSTYQDALAYSKQIGKEEQEIKTIKQLQGQP